MEGVRRAVRRAEPVDQPRRLDLEPAGDLQDRRDPQIKNATLSASELDRVGGPLTRPASRLLLVSPQRP